MQLATVIYRNPIEEWWWESGVAYWFILVATTLVLVGVAYVWGAARIAKWRRRKR